MRIAHILTDDSSISSGVGQKIDRTVTAWRRQGLDVILVGLAEGRQVDRVPDQKVAPPSLARGAWVVE